MRKLLIGVGLGLGAALVAIALGRLSFVQTIELKTYDWRMRATADPAGARSDIVLIEIDEQSIRTLAPYFGRWLMGYILTLATVGLYRPWAKVAEWRWLADNTEIS